MSETLTRELRAHTEVLSGVDQTDDQGFDTNGESDLDLQYAFGLTNPQPILLLQTGDLVEGESLCALHSWDFQLRVLCQAHRSTIGWTPSMVPSVPLREAMILRRYIFVPIPRLFRILTSI